MISSDNPTVRVTTERVIEAPQTHSVPDKEFVYEVPLGVTTPRVVNFTKLKFRNTAPLNVTDFNGAQNGHQLTVLGDGFTTIVNGANITTNTGANRLLNTNVIYHFTRFDDKWFEIGDAAGTGTAVVPVHNHDDRYYTETEVNALILVRANLPAAIAYEDESNIFTVLQNFVRPLSTDVAIAVKVTGDAFNRFSIDSAGAHLWGSGALAQEIRFYRSAASVLTLDANGGGTAVTMTYTGPINIDRVSGNNKQITGQVGAVSRWRLILGDNTAEGGADSGSDFRLVRFSDAGISLGNPIAVTRSTGLITFTGAVNAINFISAVSGIGREIDTANLRLTGGLSTNIAASGNISLYAGTHATLAGSVYVDTASFHMRSTDGATTYFRVFPTGSIFFVPYVHLNRTGTATSALLYLESDAGFSAVMILRSGATTRWQIGKGTTAESGADAGSPFQLAAHTDAGAFIDNPLSIVRAAGGIISLNRPVTITGIITGSDDIITTGGLVQVNRTGDAAIARILIDSDAGFNSIVTFRTGVSARWTAGKNTTAETGSDVGSAFAISSYTDAGVFIDSPVTITRAAGGLITLSRPVTISAGDLVVNEGAIRIVRTGDAANAELFIGGDAGFNRTIWFRTGGISRWALYTTGGAETGSDAGSSFALQAYTDAGASIDSPITIVRAAGGLITLTRPAIFIQTAVDGLVKVRQTGDTFDRVSLHNQGSIYFGPGTSAVDIRFYRSAAQVITLDGAAAGSASLIVTNNITANGNITTDSGYLMVNRVGDAVNANLYLSADAGFFSTLVFRTGVLDRWLLVKSNVAEAGGNLGSNFLIQAYDDAGVFIDSPIAINRVAAGLIILSRPVTMSSTLAVTSTITGASYIVGANQVVGARVTGWALPTATLARTTFDPDTVALGALARRVAALITDLNTHGLIGA